jgi:hypothetical protein
MPMLSTPAYSSSAQLVGEPPDMLMVKDVEATEPPAPVDHTSDLTAVPLFTWARKLQTDPLSVIELMEDEELPRAQTATMVLPLLLVYGINSEAGVPLPPVLLPAPPTREITDASGAVGVVNVKFAEVAVPAESADKAA